MVLQRVLQYAKHLLSQAVTEGEIAVDATSGNGHDTLFLAELVGESGHVYSFDIQEQAIDNTKNRLTEHGLLHRTTLILDGHENIEKYVHDEIAGAIFNLGYLPGANHEIITKGQTTISAIQQILARLKVGGMIVLVVYYGHVGGVSERDELLNYVKQLPQKYVQVAKYEFLNQKNNPPFVIALEKVKPFENL